LSAPLPPSAVAEPDAPDPKRPATWLVPGNGFEPIAPLSVRSLETAWHRLPDGRVLVARGDHIAVSTDGMKTFPEKYNIPFLKDAPAEFTEMFADGAGRGARLVISASGAWLVVCRAPYFPSKLAEFWDKTTHDYVPGLTGGQLCLTRSTDAGKTWSTPTRISDPRFTIGHPPRKILQTKSGVLLVPAQYRTPNPGRHTVSILRSTDDGVSWSPVLPTFDLPNSNGNHDGLVEPTLAQLHDGTVWLLFRTNLGTLWQSRSSDDGLNWTPLTTTGIQASSSPATLERLSDNRLVLVWNPWRDSENTPPQTRGGGNEQPAGLGADAASVLPAKARGRQAGRPPPWGGIRFEVRCWEWS